MSPLSITEIERRFEEATRRSQERRTEPEGAGWYIGLALLACLGLLLLFALGASAVHGATVSASANRVDASTLSVRLNVTVRHGTSIYLEGCADLDGILACGNGAGIKRKVHRGSNRLTVRVSNTVMAYTPPPQGTVEAWDAWSYRPGQTDVAFVWFRGRTALTEVKPLAIATETLRQVQP